jgi:catechol 2,3-dioxygenase-like lactoylglutathione lyase family enzyme
MKRSLVLSLLPLASFLCLAQATHPDIVGISHISVYTSKPDAADHFYTHDIGLTKSADPENPNGVRYWVNGFQFVEVLPLPAGAGNTRLDHLAYMTPDAERLRVYLGAHGISVPANVEKGSDGSSWFDVKDPEDNKVEFVQPPESKLGIAPGREIGRRIIHVGMLVRSRETEDPFYRGLLGFKPYWFGGMKEGKTDWVSQQVPNGHDWLEYMLTSGPSGGGIQEVSQKQLGVLNHFSIGVVNMEQAVTTLDSEGRLDNEHTGMQMGKDGKWQYNLFDPDGTRVELMEYSAVEKPCCSPFTAKDPTPEN